MTPRLGALSILVALTVLLVPGRANACSCVGGIPVCETFWGTEAVFSAEVLEVSEVAPPTDREGWPRRRVRLRVLQSWRGEQGPTVELTTGAGGGDCGYTFETREKYLVFAHRGPSGLSTGICSRTRKLVDAAEDLEYLKTAFLPAAAGRIFGSVRQSRDPYSASSSPLPIAGSTIEISNGQLTRTATTDGEGKYVFSGVAAGTYAITLKPTAGEHANGPRSVTLADPRGCAIADFYVVADGRISVRLLDASGQPRPGVTVDLVDLETARSDDGFSGLSSRKSDGAGRIEWSQLRPSRYVVTINANRPPSAAQPYQATFFPGDDSLAAAAPIELGRGDRVDLGDWKLKAELRARMIVGQVTWPDGKPAAGATVRLWGVRDSAWRSREVGAVATTDGDGRFSVAAYDGIAYEVTADLTVAPSERWRAIVAKHVAGAPDSALILVLVKSGR